MEPITFLIYALIAVLIIGAIWYVSGMVGLPREARMIILIIVALIVLLWLLRYAGVVRL